MRRKDREISNKTLIDEIIAASDVCRIAFADENTPYIVTLNFGYSGGEKPCLFFHCATEGRKIEMMKKNNKVCFQMDNGHRMYRGEKGCDWGMKYKSVVGYGILKTVENESERKTALDLIMQHYGGKGKFDYDPVVFSRTKVLKLEISEITAKQA
jgi:nitroimidazol reductase NimA-like FMN-containing flavoprotein (pyridoxamine 5'-phosphate oxidase superfamily)